MTKNEILYYGVASYVRDQYPTLVPTYRSDRVILHVSSNMANVLKALKADMPRCFTVKQVYPTKIEIIIKTQEHDT